MSPDRWRESVPAYVLGEMDAAEAATFEVVLARSPELQGELRAYAEVLGTLAAGAAGRAVAPAPTRLWRGIERRIMADSGEAAPVMPAARARVREADHRGRLAFWLWPVAAALLFLLNLAQWFWPRASVSTAKDAEPAMTASSPRSAENAAASARGTTDGIDVAAPPAMAEGDTPNGARDVDAVATADLSDRELAERYEKLASDYAELTEHVIPMLWAAAMEQRRAGVWSVEMRANPAAGPIATSGLWERVRALVPQEGLAALPDRWRLPGGVVLDPAWWTTGPFPSDPGMGPTMPPPAGGTTSRDAATPFAMALVNNAEGLGYVDLYNLPSLPVDHDLELWLRYEGDAAYTSVGTMPRSLAGGSGALVFRVPPTEARPAKLLITVEPITPTPQPTGPVVIEGP